MHFIIGALIVAGTFILSIHYKTMNFNGFWNAYSAILLGAVPVGLAIMSYRFSTIGSAFKGLARVFGARPEEERDRLARNILAFGREVRRDKGVAASRVLESERDPVFRQIGREVLQNTDPEEIEADAMILGRRDLEDFRLGERVFANLGEFAPAMGMLGTVIGLIQLLANMRDFQKLGPGMAIALLTTFYGLILAHLVYLPIARLIADYGARRADNLNLIIEGMLKLARRRPLHEVEQVVGLGDGGMATGDRAA